MQTQIYGDFVHFPALGAIEILSDYMIVVDEEGHIIHNEPMSSEKSKELRSNSCATVTRYEIPKGSFVIPTFCDLHLHAPQFLYQGTGLHLPLMQWLNEYAFKAEEKIDADPQLAQQVYDRLAHQLLEHGTGAVVLFGTIKSETNLILARTMQSKGIRAYVGKLSMDISSRPTYVEPSAEASLEAARSFSRECQHLTSDLPVHERLVQPILTPRFVPTCSNAVLHGLGQLAKEDSLWIQSHMAESLDQVQWVKAERGLDDIDVFDKYHLLTPRTIQAHCTFLDTSSLSHVAARGTSIAHCPLSNAYFSAEPFRLREALDNEVKVGLGTDIAGGYSIDIMNCMRQTVAVSRMREGTRVLQAAERGTNDDARSLSIDWKESLYLATAGGATAMGLSGGAGTLRVGAPFDAQYSRLRIIRFCTDVNLDASDSRNF
ncbi:Metallo-dependent hydrolase [Panus rudis PR-1116 ss-1]|nr:Metallo-dependent hydrolase [Panus rudis PR-1116 ss-1]